MVDKCFIGVDVSKGWVDIAVYGVTAVQRIDNTAEPVSLFKVSLQSRDVGFRPIGRFGHGDPRIDIMGGSEKVTQPRPQPRGAGHVKGDLKTGHNGDPIQVRRYVRTARTDKPARFPEEEIARKKRNGITGIL